LCNCTFNCFVVMWRNGTFNLICPLRTTSWQCPRSARLLELLRSRAHHPLMALRDGCIEEREKAPSTEDPGRRRFRNMSDLRSLAKLHCR
jgi:hypothetical protein